MVSLRDLCLLDRMASLEELQEASENYRKAVRLQYECSKKFDSIVIKEGLLKKLCKPCLEKDRIVTLLKPDEWYMCDNCTPDSLA